MVGRVFNNGAAPAGADTFGTVATAAAALTTTNGVAVPIGGAYVLFPDGTTWAAPAPISVSADANNTAIIGSDSNVFSRPSLAYEMCKGSGEIDTLDPGTGVLQNSAFPMTYTPRTSHSSSEIEFLLGATVVNGPGNDIGNLVISTGGSVIATSTNTVSVPAVGAVVPAVYTFASPISFSAGQVYEFTWSNGNGVAGPFRTDTPDPCLPIDYVGQTLQVRIPGSSAASKVLVTEYLNSDLTTAFFIIRDECTGVTSNETTLPAGLTEC